MAYRAEKMCPQCRETKLLSDFYTRANGRTFSWCIACSLGAVDNRRLRLPGDQAIRTAKHRAKKAGVAFDLDQHKAEIMARMQAGCELTGLSFVFGAARTWNSPSIDRVKAGGGYVMSNIRIILWGLNSTFNNWGEDAAAIFVAAWLDRRI